MSMTTRPELQGDDPILLFQDWLLLAERQEVNDPTAAALATATCEAVPSVRMVLVKGADQSGFSFYTNAESQKGTEMEQNPVAALCFHWKSLRRQVRATGAITTLPVDVSDLYFHSRSRRSQIGAAVSRQSHLLPSREDLVTEVAHFEEAHRTGEIPRPDFWHGYLLSPSSVEFWIDGPDRLHDRIRFRKQEDQWIRELLYP